MSTIIQYHLFADVDVPLRSVRNITSDNHAALTFCRILFSQFNRKSDMNIILTQEMEDLYKAVTGTEESFFLLQGPPGSGKTTTLYWLYMQLVEKTSLYTTVCVPYKNLKNYADEIARTVAEISDTKVVVVFVDVIEPRTGFKSLDHLFTLLTNILYKNVKVVIAVSSLFNAYMELPELSSLVSFRNNAFKITTGPFTPIFAASRGYAKDSLEACFLKRVHTSSLVQILTEPDKVDIFKQTEFNALINYMANNGRVIRWQQEVKLLMAAIKQLPVESVGISAKQASGLCLMQSYLLYLENGVPKCYFELTDDDVALFVTPMWSYCSQYIKCDNNSMVGIFFETQLPRYVFQGGLLVDIKQLHPDENVSAEKLSINLNLGSIALPMKYGIEAALRPGTLYHTSDSYVAADYLYVTESSLLGNEEIKKSLIAIEASIQKRSLNDKISNKITSLVPDLTQGKDRVIWIFLDPFAASFDEHYDYAREATTSRNATATDHYKKYWYGQPQSLNASTALMAYLQNVFQEYC